MKLKTTAALALMAATLAFGTAHAQQAQQGQGGQQARPPLAPLLFESSAFPDGGIVPPKYAIRGGSTQPGFRISHAPAGTQSFAVIFHDISVALNNGTDDVLHWVAWNIPGNTTEIPEGRLPEGSVTGKNISGQNTYIGPGAPPGPRYHHYLFEFYALNTKLDLPDTASRKELLEAMQGKVIAKSSYLGRYKSEEAPAGAPPARPAQ